MPTYQYACTDCGKEHEAVQKFSDASLTVCPSCGGKLRKVYGAVGVVFKGSGFYKTDSRTSNNGAPATAKKDGESSSSETKADAPKTDAPKTDSKVEKKSETKAPAATPAS